MRILVICGAGASSTFVAQRVRHAAHERGLTLTAFAGTEQSLPIDLDTADVVLVGPHLASSLDRIHRVAATRKVEVVLLPDDVFADRGGERTLDHLLAAIAPDQPTPDGTSASAGSRPTS